VSETGIHLYDTGSGQPMGKLFEGVALQGLTCATGRP
jgi:hypothetical protein